MKRKRPEENKETNDEKRKENKTRPHCRCDHQAVLKWPECPPDLSEHINYNEFVIDPDRRAVCGRIQYRRDTSLHCFEHDYRFVRILAPNLSRRLHAVLSSLLPELISLVVEYYGDIVRMIGAEFSWRGDRPEEYGYGYAFLQICARDKLLYFVEEDYGDPDRSEKEKKRDAQEIDITTMWETPRSNEPLRKEGYSYIITADTIPSLGLTWEHVDFTRIVENFQTHFAKSNTNV